MAMTITDYERIASAINYALKNNANIIDVLADTFSSTNPRFNTDGFVKECLKDFVPEKKAELSGIIVGAAYELQSVQPEDPSWMEEGMHVVLIDIDKWDSEYPLRVVSLDAEARDSWIHLEQLGKMVRLP